MKKPFKVMSTTALTAAFAAAAVVPVQAEVVNVNEVETHFDGIVIDVEGVNTVVPYSDYFDAIIDLEQENENELLDVIVGEDGLIKPPTYVQVGDNFYSASDYVDVVTNNEGSSLDELIQTLTSEKTPLTEEETEDFVPYEPGDGELVVESVSAITPTEVEVSLNVDLEEISKDDLVVTNQDGEKQYVKSVEIVGADAEVQTAAASKATTLKVEFYNPLKSGDTYTFTVNVDGEEVSAELEFEIADVAEVTAPSTQTFAPDVNDNINLADKLEFKVIDENGLDITSISNVEFESTSTITDNKINLKDGQSTIVYVVVKDNNGEELARSEKIIVKAEAPSLVEITDVTIASGKDQASAKTVFEAKDYERVTTVEESTNGTPSFVVVAGVDQYGDADYPTDVSYQSLDEDVALVDKNTGKIIPLKQGTFPVKVTVGKVTKVVEFEVVADAKVTSIEVDKAEFDLSNQSVGQKVKVTTKDQYGAKKSPEKATVKVLSGEDVVNVDSTLSFNNGEAELNVKPVAGKSGKAVIEVSVSDEIKATVTVNVKEPGVIDSYQVDGFESVIDKYDDEKNDTPNSMTLSVLPLDENGIVAGPAASDVTYTVKDSKGKKVENAVEEDGKTIKASTFEKTGKYTLEVKVGTVKVDTLEFEVVDTTPKPNVEFTASTLDIGQNGDLAEALAEIVRVDYKNKTYTVADGYNVKLEHIEFVSNNSKVIESNSETAGDREKNQYAKLGDTANIKISKLTVKVFDSDTEETLLAEGTVEFDNETIKLTVVATEGDVELSNVATVPADSKKENEINYNPYGAYRVDLDFGETPIVTDKGEANIKPLTVSLLKDNKVLAVNELTDRYYEDVNAEGGYKNAGATKISSPFNLGTGVLDKWAWKRGAYAEGVTEGFEAYIPTHVKVDYVVNGINYTKTFAVTGLTLPESK